jgi:hypothetical protein
VPQTSLIRVLLLREAISRTLNPEERCLIALGHFEAALNTLLDNVPESGSVTSATSKVTGPPSTDAR